MIYTTPNTVNPPLGTVHEPDGMLPIGPGEWEPLIERYRVVLTGHWPAYDATITGAVDAFIGAVTVYQNDLKLMPKADSNAIVQALWPMTVCHANDYWRAALASLHALLVERRSQIP